MPAELALQLRHPRPQHLDHPGLLGVGRPQPHNDRRLDRDGRLQIGSRIREQLGLRHSSGHARLPMGLRESYPTTPHQVNPPTTAPGPEQLHLTER